MGKLKHRVGKHFPQAYLLQNKWLVETLIFLPGLCLPVPGALEVSIQGDMQALRGQLTPRNLAAEIGQGHGDTRLSSQHRSP